MNRNRLTVLAVCVVGVILAGALIFRSGVFSPPPAPSAVGGPFQLVDYDGKPVDETVLKGKWSALFFGFTYCPDVCPGTLQALATASDQLGPKAKDLQIVMVSVDPQRDTPAVMKTYLTAGYLPKNIVGLTGTPAQVDAAVKTYRGYYKKVGDGPDYSVDHSTAIYVIDPKGRFDRVIAYSLPPEEIARQLKAAMEGR
ncbi:SCO family protein [Caulobacter sp. D4A]|uniref:SCO family protein n=1 Tax=unclassified Caulobacter TaxID=2648921 RepID=UPI000D72E309|nr:MULTISPECIES: SCO family protein [unclassified Caulobacter]PXA85748.1 SCO family protein [Caulobacter sp. D4A]PXA94888.1 SCO family protein [Caulobacter sp. D5]